MDPFEEFEIKPLTDGLGFHKKQVTLSEQVRNSGLLEDQSARVPMSQPTEKQQAPTKAQTFDDILKALERPVKSAKSGQSMPSRSSQMSDPLPKSAASTEIEFPRSNPSRPTPQPSPIAPRTRLPSESPLSKVVESVGLKRGAADSPVRMLERASVSFSSAILDGVVVFALSLVFLVALTVVTKVDLASVVVQVGIDVPTKVAFAVLFLSVMLMYVVVSRSFFGRTLGEWTFDLQIGDDKQQLAAVYPIRVLWRTLVVMATGVIVLPLISWMANKDLLASVSGLQLYRQR